MRSASDGDTGRAALVRAATTRFAAGGIAATSLREVAKAAGVSPALVVHHFGGKEGLVAAVDAAAVRSFGEAWEAGDATAPEVTDPSELLRRRAAQTARAMRERPDVCAYLGRALVEGTPGSARLFRLLIDGGRAEVDALAQRGALRDDADRLWATLQHFLLIWAPLAFRPLLEREALDGGSLLDEDQLARWVEANVALLERGLYR